MLERSVGDVVWSSMAMGMMVGSRSITRHQREVMQHDHRWLLTWVASFMISLAFLSGAYSVYKVTGPHPEIRAFMRAVKHEVRWLIPGLKGKPKPQPSHTVRLEADHLRYAAVDLPRG